ncbi:GTPase-activating protein gyp7 [Pelomyxa schiedti]|nr:GTPase-activating protein gyp7 [Pelomyxa schiedti]
MDAVRNQIRLIQTNDPGVTEWAALNSGWRLDSAANLGGLLEGLRTNTCLQVLRLSELGLTDSDAKMIAEVLPVNSTLKTLDLSRNRIGMEGAIAIAQGLRNNNSIKELVLLDNPRYSDAVLMAYAEMFEDNTALTKITWRVESRAATRVTSMLSRNKEIERRIRQGQSTDSIDPKKRRERDAALASASQTTTPSTSSQSRPLPCIATAAASTGGSRGTPTSANPMPQRAALTQQLLQLQQQLQAQQLQQRRPQPPSRPPVSPPPPQQQQQQHQQQQQQLQQQGVEPRRKTEHINGTPVSLPCPAPSAAPVVVGNIAEGQRPGQVNCNANSNCNSNCNCDVNVKGDGIGKQNGKSVGGDEDDMVVVPGSSSPHSSGVGIGVAKVRENDVEGGEAVVVDDDKIVVVTPKKAAWKVLVSIPNAIIKQNGNIDKPGELLVCTDTAVQEPLKIVWKPSKKECDEFVDLGTNTLVESKCRFLADESSPEIEYNLIDIHSIARHQGYTGHEPPFIQLTLKDKSSSPKFYLIGGGVRALIAELMAHVTLTRSEVDHNVLLVNNKSDPWVKSHEQLILSAQQLSLEASYLLLPPTVKKDMGYQSYFKVFENFSATLFSRRKSEDTPAPLPKEVEPASTSPHDLYQFEIIESYSPSVERQQTLPPISPSECIDTSPIVPQDPSSPLTSKEWRQYLESCGQIQEKPKQELLSKIFHRGVDPTIRKEVWKYLLGYYPWEMNKSELSSMIDSKRTEYNALKTQWTSISHDQERRWTKYRLRKQQVEKDAVRTDRTHPFFAGEGNPHIKTLFDILLTYTCFNMDLGYMQGMNDICGVIFEVMEGDEVDTFWCFKSIMDKMEMNFHKEQPGIREQITALKDLLQVLDPPFYSYLKSVDADNMFFCYRWLVIIFKREFEFDVIKRLWESIWSHSSPSFHLFIALAILLQHRNKIINGKFDFDSIIQFINNLSGTIPVLPLIEQADRLFTEYINSGVTVQRDYILGVPELYAKPPHMMLKY